MAKKAKWVNKRRIGYWGGALLSAAALSAGVVCHLFEKPYHMHLPIVVSAQGTPLIEAVIQNQTHLLEIDLGSKFQVTLNKQFLDHLEKIPKGILSNRDMKGKAYEAPAYEIPLITIGELIFDHVIARENNEEFFTNNTFCMNQTDSTAALKDKTGSIGRALLEQRNLLLDIKGSRLFISNDREELKNAGYDLSKFKKAPFQTGKSGVILISNTDLGKTRLSLDTGSAISYIRNTPANTFKTKKDKSGLAAAALSKFEIGGHDFGNVDLYIQDISADWHEFDGILGLDFIKKHAIYFDYANRMVYIQP
jgi:hypothetical protein